MGAQGRIYIVARYFAGLVIPVGLLLSSCGEEKGLSIKQESLVINDQPVIDSVCTAYEMVPDYDQHYKEILNTLPATHRKVSDVRTAFRRHIRDSSLTKQSKGVMEYRLDHDRIIYMHSKTLPVDLDSIVFIKVYDAPHVIKKEPK